MMSEPELKKKTKHTNVQLGGTSQGLATSQSIFVYRSAFPPS